MHLFLREDVIFGIAWNVDGELRAPFLIIERSCEIWLYIESNSKSKVMKTKSTREKWLPIASYFQCNLINTLQLNKVQFIVNS